MAILAYFPDFMTWKPFNTEFSLASQGARQNQVWDMLSKRPFDDDDRLQGSSRSQREYTQNSTWMWSLSPSLRFQSSSSEDGANVLGPPAKSWCLGLLFTQFQSQTGLKESGVHLSLFKMRTCLPNTMWSPQTPHTTIPPTWEASASASASFWRRFCSVVRVSLWVHSSLSMLSSVPHDLLPPAVVAECQWRHLTP